MNQPPRIIWIVNQLSTAPQAPSVWPRCPFAELTGMLLVEQPLHCLRLGDVALLRRRGVRIHVADGARATARASCSASRIATSIVCVFGWVG